jgi:hypothetical protein
VSDRPRRTSITYRRSSAKARRDALSAAEAARRQYDLRHACASTWLNGGIAPAQVRGQRH